MGHLEVVGDDVVGRHRHRQRRPVAGVDPATQRRQGDRDGGLPPRRHFVRSGVEDLDVDEAGHQEQERDDEGEADQSDATLERAGRPRTPRPRHGAAGPPWPVGRWVLRCGRGDGGERRPTPPRAPGRSGVRGWRTGLARFEGFVAAPAAAVRVRAGRPHDLGAADRADDRVDVTPRGFESARAARIPGRVVVLMGWRLPSSKLRASSTSPPSRTRRCPSPAMAAGGAVVVVVGAGAAVTLGAGRGTDSET